MESGAAHTYPKNTQGGLWSVEGGNWRVCDGLLSSSKATVYKNTRVTEVVKNNNGGTERPVYTLKGDGNIPDKQYDMVIVAAPLEISSYFFDCKGCRNWPSPKELGEFWRTVATFVHGHINLTHFGFGTEYDIPEVIGTTETPLASNSLLKTGLRRIQRGHPFGKCFHDQISLILNLMNCSVV